MNEAQPPLLQLKAKLQTSMNFLFLTIQCFQKWRRQRHSRILKNMSSASHNWSGAESNCLLKIRQTQFRVIIFCWLFFRFKLLICYWVFSSFGSVCRPKIRPCSQDRKPTPEQGTAPKKQPLPLATPSTI